MGIKTFIQEEILARLEKSGRLQKSGVLIVYDAAQRYRELCLELAGEQRRVVDASESSIESREAALSVLQQMGVMGAAITQLVVYVPAAAPQTEKARVEDPFYLYAVCGQIFPNPENDGDEYLSLCIKARPDYATEIRRIFDQNPTPAFAVMDAVGAGGGWPQLQALLGVESARNLLLALLAPSGPQLAALNKQPGWVAEARVLAQSALGLKLLTRSESWDAIADELWRFLLFSEFSFDLAGALPPTLTNVPRAGEAARLLVEALCRQLRDDRQTRSRYIERAEAIEAELNLPFLCQESVLLGLYDTFPFEERRFFAQALEAFKHDDLDTLRDELHRREASVWVERGENQKAWALLQAAVSLVEACHDISPQLGQNLHTQEALLNFYTGSVREVDRRQREFEQAAGDFIDLTGQMAEVMQQARQAYRRFGEQIQTVFIKYLETAGWPPLGRLANVDVFDRLVAPKLRESGRRVALLLIDALRYELGVELHKQLIEEGPTELHIAFAQLPSITAVGMASLLPNAGQNLTLIRKHDQALPALEGQPLSNVTQRMDVLRRRYGQRFAEVALADFVNKKVDVPAPVELLVVRSNEMDSDFESNPEAAPGLINRTFQRIRAALHNLRELGFQEVIIATDHGFYLNAAVEPGDSCAKPPGAWINCHDRLLLGDGASDAANFVLSAEQVGIRGDFAQAAGPRALVAYRAGQRYFHGGASLQETVVPVLEIQLAARPESRHPPTVVLRYKRGARRITTRLPVFELSMVSGDLFSTDTPLEILVEAHDAAGRVVGEALPVGAVNPATRTLSLTSNLAVQLTLRMEETFEGKFTVKALDPTTLATLSQLELETDYTV